jgi:hypothetical protein
MGNLSISGTTSNSKRNMQTLGIQSKQNGGGNTIKIVVLWVTYSVLRLVYGLSDVTGVSTVKSFEPVQEPVFQTGEEFFSADQSCNGNR